MTYADFAVAMIAVNKFYPSYSINLLSRPNAATNGWRPQGQPPVPCQRRLFLKLTLLLIFSHFLVARMARHPRHAATETCMADGNEAYHREAAVMEGVLRLFDEYGPSLLGSREVEYMEYMEQFKKIARRVINTLHVYPEAPLFRPKPCNVPAPPMWFDNCVCVWVPNRYLAPKREQERHELAWEARVGVHLQRRCTDTYIPFCRAEARYIYVNAPWRGFRVPQAGGHKGNREVAA